MKLKLPQAKPGEAKLEMSTIMDRALAAKYGGAYVRMAAFAIDVDRAFVETEPQAEALIGKTTPAPDEEAELPFGWEVFLTAAALCALDLQKPDTLTMLEDSVLFVLEQAPEDQGYGSQLVFAVYDLVARERLPHELRDLFRAWRARPKQLVRSLDALWANSEVALPALAEHCLHVELDPPLAPPTRETLQSMARGEWPLPRT